MNTRQVCGGIAVHSDAALCLTCSAAALTSAGYRILAPGELDGVSLEAAAQVADKRAAMAGTVSHEAARALLVALPDAIRALKASPAETDGEQK